MTTEFFGNHGPITTHVANAESDAINKTHASDFINESTSWQRVVMYLNHLSF
jgi:hypothetical protein